MRYQQRDQDQQLTEWPTTNDMHTFSKNDLLHFRKTHSLNWPPLYVFLWKIHPIQTFSRRVTMTCNKLSGSRPPRSVDVRNSCSMLQLKGAHQIKGSCHHRHHPCWHPCETSPLTPGVQILVTPLELVLHPLPYYDTLVETFTEGHSWSNY